MTTRANENVENESKVLRQHFKIHSKNGYYTARPEKHVFYELIKEFSSFKSSRWKDANRFSIWNVKRFLRGWNALNAKNKKRAALNATCFLKCVRAVFSPLNILILEPFRSVYLSKTYQSEWFLFYFFKWEPFKIAQRALQTKGVVITNIHTLDKCSKIQWEKFVCAI